MNSARKPWWQQATALVTVSAGGVITGFNFAPGAATLTTPASVPLHQLALEQAAQPDTAGKAAASDAQLRAAIVNVARYYLKLAKTKTPAQVEALIWGEVSGDGTDHGPSCAAFASLTLELAAQTTGLRSWVTGGTTYPWPLPAWADVRVDTNPASPQVTSVVADAQAHGRWHPLGDGYIPQPGDWAVYDGHVAVVTSYSGGVLDTIAADSLPGLTVNAHSSAAPLADQGIVGFVDNGNLQPASGDTPGQAVKTAPQPGSTAPANAKAAPAKAKAKQRLQPPPWSPACPARPRSRGRAAFPAPDPLWGTSGAGEPAKAAVPGVLATGQLLGEPAASTARPRPTPRTLRSGERRARACQAIPAGRAGTGRVPSPSSASSSPKQYATPGTRNQQAFISLVAPGTVAAQQRYGVPASVTIAQAIEESAWGQSSLAARYHNLFGIKGTGPAGSVTLPTQEYENGSWVTVDAQFAVYHNDAESIADHAELLATSGYYARAMADRAYPDAFANDLTGVYATDPGYGANLIALMKLYNLYQYDTAPAATPAAATPAPAPSQASAPASGSIPGVISPGKVTSGATDPARQAPTRTVERRHDRVRHPRARRQRARPRRRRPVPGAAAAGGDDRPVRHRERTPGPGRAPVPRRGRDHGRQLEAAGGRRLDAVQGRPPLLTRPGRETRNGQRRRHLLPHQDRRPRPVRRRPHRTVLRGLRYRPHRPPPAVRPRARRRVRRVPLGCPPQAARRVPDGVPLLGGRPYRRAPEDALAAHRRPLAHPTGPAPASASRSARSPWSSASATQPPSKSLRRASGPVPLRPYEVRTPRRRPRSSVMRTAGPDTDTAIGIAPGMPTATQRTPASISPSSRA